MNIGPLVNSARSFLGNKYTAGTALGGLMGLSRGKAIWNATPSEMSSIIKEQWQFKVPIDVGDIDTSFLNPENLAAMIERQYPKAGLLLDNFTLRYDPIAKTVEFEPTEKFIAEAITDTGVLTSTKIKLQSILPPTLSHAAFGLAGAAIFDKGPEAAGKLLEFIQGRKGEESSRLAQAVFDELEKRAVCYELDTLCTGVDVDRIIQARI